MTQAAFSLTPALSRWEREKTTPFQGGYSFSENALSPPTEFTVDPRSFFRVFRVFRGSIKFFRLTACLKIAKTRTRSWEAP
jgi:hypothetical protein